MSYLFAYGTLRQGFNLEVNEQLKPFLRYVCQGYFNGRLFEVDNYPAAIESTESSYPILGDVFEILDEDMAWPILDAYEESSTANPEPHEYIRNRILIHTEANESLSAWVYSYNYPCDGLEEIISGDYLEYRNRK